MADGIKTKGTRSISELVSLRKGSVITSFVNAVNPRNSSSIKGSFGSSSKNRGFTSGITNAFFSRGAQNEFAQIVRTEIVIGPYDINTLSSIDSGEPDTVTTFITDGGFPDSIYTYIVDGNSSRIIYYS